MVVYSVRLPKHVQAGCFAIVLLAPTGQASAAREKVLHAFKGGTDGNGPSGSLVDIGGVLYGTTTGGGALPFGGGTLFKVTTGGTETILHAFTGVDSGSDGAEPSGSLINVNGTLYGTTAGGGPTGDGTVFKSTTTGVERALYAFKGSGDGEDGGALINVGGTFYGTTVLGGPSGYGTVFKLTRAGAETLLYAFKGGSDGAYPASVINVGGTLYGTTSGGGSTNCPLGCGTVFTLTPAGTKTVLYSFQGGSDGDGPDNLIIVGGTFFGTTGGGGSTNCQFGCGMVFKLTRTGAESVLYAFKGGSDGAYPASLTNVGVTFYGTTSGGGSNLCAGGCGTVFKLSPTAAETVIYAFQGGSDGESPRGGLTNQGGTFYGTTFNGGSTNCQDSSDGCGTVFQITP